MGTRRRSILGMPSAPGCRRREVGISSTSEPGILLCHGEPPAVAHLLDQWLPPHEADGGGRTPPARQMSADLADGGTFG